MLDHPTYCWLLLLSAAGARPIHNPAAALIVALSARSVIVSKVLIFSYPAITSPCAEIFGISFRFQQTTTISISCQRHGRPREVVVSAARRIVRGGVFVLCAIREGDTLQQPPHHHPEHPVNEALLGSLEQCETTSLNNKRRKFAARRVVFAGSCAASQS